MITKIEIIFYHSNFNAYKLTCKTISQAVITAFQLRSAPDLRINTANSNICKSLPRYYFNSNDNPL